MMDFEVSETFDESVQSVSDAYFAKIFALF